MKPGTWVMRHIAAVEYVERRQGHHAHLTLSCGHVIQWKASRYRKYAPKRCRCEDCEEILTTFKNENTCREIIAKIEGLSHDFILSTASADESRSGESHARGRVDKSRPMVRYSGPEAGRVRPRFFEASGGNPSNAKR